MLIRCIASYYKHAACVPVFYELIIVYQQRRALIIIFNVVIYAPIYTVSGYARLAYNLIKSADNLLLMPTTVSLISLKIMHGSSG